MLSCCLLRIQQCSLLDGGQVGVVDICDDREDSVTVRLMLTFILFGLLIIGALILGPNLVSIETRLDRLEPVRLLHLVYPEIELPGDPYMRRVGHRMTADMHSM